MVGSSELFNGIGQLDTSQDSGGAGQLRTLGCYVKFARGGETVVDENIALISPLRHPQRNLSFLPVLSQGMTLRETRYHTFSHGCYR
jgi:hypothetical protein